MGSAWRLPDRQGPGWDVHCSQSLDSSGKRKTFTITADLTVVCQKKKKKKAGGNRLNASVYPPEDT